MRGALDWLDELEPTPGARPRGGRARRRGPGRRAGSGRPLPTLRPRDRDGAGRRCDPRPADDPGAARDRAGRGRPADAVRGARAGLADASTVTGATPARIAACFARARSAGDAHGSPIEAAAAALGLAGRVARGDPADRSSPPGGRSLGPGRIEPWDYWHAVGAAARRLDRLVPVDRPARPQPALPGGARRGPGRARHHVRRPAAPGTAADPGGVHDRDGRMGDWPAGWRTLDAATAVGLRDVRRKAASATSLELLHESGHALHYAAVRARPAFLDWTAGDTGVPRGHGRRRRLGRGRARPGSATGSATRRRRARPS